MAINDFGDIVGQGFHEGSSYAVLLLPTVLNSFKLTPNPVVGRQNVLGSLKLSAAAPYNLTIALESNNPAVISHLQNVVIAAGQKSATFQISTLSVTTTTFVNLQASFGGVTLQQTLQVTH
jgi:hypothetical protein